MGFNEMENQDRFNKFAAEILSTLYVSFPVSREFNIETFQHLNTSENSSIFFDTIKFLKDEGFVRYDKQYYGGFAGVVLTSKGFSVLKAPPPDIFKNSTTIGDAIKNTLEIGKTELVKNSIAEIIKFSLKLIMVINK